MNPKNSDAYIVIPAPAFDPPEHVNVMIRPRKEVVTYLLISAAVQLLIFHSPVDVRHQVKR